jgi:hypothetical protein
MVCPVCVTTAVVANLPAIGAGIGGLMAVKIAQLQQRPAPKQQKQKQKVQEKPIVDKPDKQK